MKNLKKVAWKNSRPPFSNAPIFIPMPKPVLPGLCSQPLHLNDSSQSGQGPLQLGYSQPIDPHHKLSRQSEGVGELFLTLGQLLESPIIRTWYSHARGVIDFTGCTDFNQPSLTHDTNPVRNLFDHGQIMGNE